RNFIGRLEPLRWRHSVSMLCALLRRIGVRNHCLSPSFLCCPGSKPWQMIRQKGDRKIGLVLAQAKTTKCVIGLENSVSRPNNSRPPSGRSGTRRKQSKRAEGRRNFIVAE